MTPDAGGFSSKGWNCESQSEAEGVLKIGRPPVIIHMFIRHFPVPSGKHTKNYGKSPFSMGKSTISMAIFNSYVKSPEGNHPVIIHKSGPLRKPPHYLVILSRLKHPHLSPRLPTSSSVTEKESKLMLNISSPMACSTATCAWKTGETVLNHGLCAWLCLYIQNVHDTYLHSYTNIAWIFCHGTYIILYTVYTCLHMFAPENNVDTPYILLKILPSDSLFIRQIERTACQAKRERAGYIQNWFHQHVEEIWSSMSQKSREASLQSHWWAKVW